MIELLLGVKAPTQIELLQKINEEPPAIVKELTLEEKIKTNFYKCNTNLEWIRADDATCLPKRTTPTNKATAQAPVASQSVSGNTYTPGQCTWHTKNVLGWVPNGWGNATNWASNAQAQGYTLSSTPKVGAVAWRSGHVAAVVGVGDGTVTISEMNYDWVPYHQRIITLPVSDYYYIY